MKTPWQHTIAAAIFLVLLSGMGDSARATGGHYTGSPEFLYYMEGTGAYFLPEAEADLFFHLGRWYRRSGSSWSASVALTGPWGAISISDAPSVLVNLPGDFRTSVRFGRVPYRHVIGTASGGDDFGSRFYSDRYHDDHERRGYQRRRHSSGDFWFFIAPELRLEHRFDHYDRDDDRDDDRRRRRRRGRGRD